MEAYGDRLSQKDKNNGLESETGAAGFRLFPTSDACVSGYDRRCLWRNVHFRLLQASRQVIDPNVLEANYVLQFQDFSRQELSNKVREVHCRGAT